MWIYMCDYITLSLVWFYGISTIVGDLMPNPVFIYILNIWFVNTSCRCTQLNDLTVLFLTIQFSMSFVCSHFKWSNSSTWPIDRTLTGDTTPGQSGTGSNGNEEVLHIPQISNITTAPPSDFLVSYPRHLCVCVCVGSYPPTEMQSMYSTAPSWKIMNTRIYYEAEFSVGIPKIWWKTHQSPSVVMILQPRYLTPESSSDEVFCWWHNCCFFDFSNSIGIKIYISFFVLYPGCAEGLVNTYISFLYLLIEFLKISSFE